MMGILNVTPDSFSDGGDFLFLENALNHGLQLIKDGADILDIGAMSTSPNSKAISVDEEIKRLIPVISALKKAGIYNISVDTMRALVAKEALKAGASWINDQSAGLFDDAMAEIMADADAVVIMHSKGASSGVMAGEHIHYDDVVNDIRTFFVDRIHHLCVQGLSKQKIIVDPGIGFGKGLKDSLSIINNMKDFEGLAAMSLIGLSRKSFLYPITGIEDPKDRDLVSLGAHAAAIASGAHIIRTHNVKLTKEFVMAFNACRAHKENS